MVLRIGGSAASIDTEASQAEATAPAQPAPAQSDTSSAPGMASATAAPAAGTAGVAAADGPLFGAFGPFAMDGSATPRSEMAGRLAHWANANPDLWKSRPEKGDMRAWFGDREIRLQELVIRVAGPGVHGRTAMPVAGNAGVLDLNAADPSDVLEQTKTRLAAKTAVLTLRNSPR